jgi:16S rRNA (cytosine1402-N4)-methyltransferase
MPVMLQEFLSFFSDQKLKTFFDGTVGAGGHSRALLEAHPEVERMFVCDQDLSALAIAREELAPWKDKVEFIHSNFSHLDQILAKRGVEKVDGFFLI